MLPDCHPLRALLLTFADWASREQQRTIEYLAEGSRVLKEQLGGRRLRLTDDQRRRLAAKGKALGRRLLGRVVAIVTPDTLLRWHQRLTSGKGTFKNVPSARAVARRQVRVLVIRMAKENPSWGYERIVGEVKVLGHQISSSTVARVLKENAMRPAPERPLSWSAFIKATWGENPAAGFFTTEVWTPRGLTTFYTLFAIDLASRRVHIAGTTVALGEAFMGQMARNLADVIDGFLLTHRRLFIDRDSNFGGSFCARLARAGVETVRIPPSAPNCNAYAERFVRSIKKECLRKMIFFGKGSLRRAIRGYVSNYNQGRPHQGLGNERIERVVGPRSTSLEGVVEEERLGGILRSYRVRPRDGTIRGRSGETSDMVFEIDRVSSDPTARRGREQMIHDAYPAADLDKIRPIAEKNPKRLECLAAGEKL